MSGPQPIGVGVRFVRLLREMVEFCYPTTCAICREPCAHQSLCDVCAVQFRAVAASAACPLCGLSLAYRGAPCPHCGGKGVRHYDRIVRLGAFEAPLRGLVHRLKYSGHWNLGELLADRLLDLEPVKTLLSETDCLVPVPLHRWRQFTRGYNQAEIVARRLSRHCDIPVAQAVVRVRNTETQTHLHSRSRRMRNLRDAFKLIDESEIERRHVVVIDDVMTTGATLQTLARALRPARPASLSAIVIAVADHKTRPVADTITAH